MSTYTRTPSNGVSFGTIVTAVTADQTAGFILVDFGTEYDLVASILVTDGNDENVALEDAVITYPEEGQIKIENGNSLFTVTTGYQFHIIAQRNKTD